MSFPCCASDPSRRRRLKDPAVEPAQNDAGASRATQQSSVLCAVQPKEDSSRHDGPLSRCSIIWPQTTSRPQYRPYDLAMTVSPTGVMSGPHAVERDGAAAAARVGAANQFSRVGRILGCCRGHERAVSISRELARASAAVIQLIALLSVTTVRHPRSRKAAAALIHTHHHGNGRSRRPVRQSVARSLPVL